MLPRILKTENQDRRTIPTFRAFVQAGSPADAALYVTAFYSSHYTVSYVYTSFEQRNTHVFLCKPKANLRRRLTRRWFPAGQAAVEGVR